MGQVKGKKRLYLSAEGMSSFRMKFELDESRNSVKVVGTYDEGGRDESPRDK